MTRRIVRLFRIERIRLRQWHVSFIQKIQRAFRGHSSRLKIINFKDQWFHTHIMNQYLNERKEQKNRSERQLQHERTHLLYLKQRKDEFTVY